MPVRRSGVANAITTSLAVAQSGLAFLGNSVAGSDIRLEWSGANLLSRTAHTAIWKVRYEQQSGFYALWWHCWGDSSFHFSNYEFGAHPYPCDGTAHPSGAAANPTGSDGTVHYMELAGLGGGDHIASPGPGGVFLIPKGSWLTQARTCEVIGGTTLRHRVYPDLANNPSLLIESDILLSSLEAATSPRFLLGGSPWTASGSLNSETPGPASVARAIQLYDAGLSLAEIQARMDLTTDAAVVAANPGSLFYCNLNPTPSDITDKSGAGHTPSWANANRPTLWSGLT